MRPDFPRNFQIRAVNLDASFILQHKPIRSKEPPMKPNVIQTHTTPFWQMIAAAGIAIAAILVVIEYGRIESDSNAGGECTATSIPTFKGELG